MPRRTPEDIIAMVNAHESSTTALRTRMDKDYGRYRLEEFKETDPRGNSVTGFRRYTSNEPQTGADKVISWITRAKRIIRVPPWGAQREEREDDSAKERFLIGAFREADDRLARQMLPGVQDQNAFLSNLRGIIAGRALLRKRKDGSTFVDIFPWDILHTFWEIGPEGLEWICFRMLKTRAQIKSEYGVNIDDTSADGIAARDDGALVYDFYDKQNNQVVMENQVLKKPTRHGSPSTPAYIAAVGPAPPIFRYGVDSVEGDASADYGESVYKGSRDIYDKHNLMMSIMLELVARVRKPPVAVKSRSGDKTLDEDPYQEGTELALAEGEEVKALAMLEMTRDAMPFMAQVSGEMQRAMVAHTAFGELPFQLSGFAINTLAQGFESKVAPALSAVENADNQIAHILIEQYETGRFKPITLRGTDNEKQFFDEEFNVEAVKRGGNVEVRLVSILPQDDMSKMSIAQMAREGPTPLLPDRYLWDEVLQIQDTDQIADMIKEQMGERGSPLAVLYSLMDAAAKQGRIPQAKIYLKEAQFEMLKKELELSQLQAVAATMPGLQTNGNGDGGGPPTVDPRAAPNAMMGAPPPTPTPQSGPNVSPGSPRPGAQSDETRLLSMGLAGPRG